MIRSYISPRLFRLLLLGGLLLAASSGRPAENMRVTDDIPYTDPGGAQPDLLALDIYAPQSGAGYPVEVYPAENKNHLTLNRELGFPGDPPTKEVLAFFAALLAK